MKDFDFEAHTPPVITESDLRRLANTRSLRRNVAVVSVGTVLTLVAVLIFCAVVIRKFPLWGLLSLIAPAYFIIGGALILSVFILSRKRSAKRDRRNQKEV